MWLQGIGTVRAAVRHRLWPFVTGLVTDSSHWKEKHLLWVLGFLFIYLFNPAMNHIQCTLLKMSSCGRRSKSCALLTSTVPLSPAKSYLILALVHTCRITWFVCDLKIKFWFFSLATLILQIFRWYCGKLILVLFSFTQIEGIFIAVFSCYMTIFTAGEYAS